MSMGNWVQCSKTKAAAVVLSHAMYGICFLLDGLMGYAYAPLLPISVLFAMHHWAAEVVQLYTSLKHWSVWNVQIYNNEAFLMIITIIITLKASSVWDFVFFSVKCFLPHRQNSFSIFLYGFEGMNPVLHFPVCELHVFLRSWAIVRFQFPRTLNFSSTISARELQADRLRNKTTPGRTLAVLKGLFKVLVGLTPREIERVWNGIALQFHRFIISGSTTGSAEIGEEGVHAFVLHRCPGGFTLKWKTCRFTLTHPPQLLLLQLIKIC